MDSRAIVIIYCLSFAGVWISSQNIFSVEWWIYAFCLIAALQLKSGRPDPRSTCILNAGRYNGGVVYLYRVRFVIFSIREFYERGKEGWLDENGKKPSNRIAVMIEAVYCKELLLHNKILNVIANPYPADDPRLKMTIWPGAEEPPLPKGTDVFIRFRSGNIKRSLVGEGYALRWAHRMEPDDIIAYCEIKKDERPPEPRR